MQPYRRKVIIGDCTLYLGDAMAIMPTLGNIDSVVTDPPYEFDTAGAGIFRSNRKNMDEIAAANLANGFDHTIFNSEQCGSIIVFCHNDQLVKLIPYINSQYQKLAVCSWHKTNPMPVANKHYQPDTEFWIHGWSGRYHPIGELKDKKRFYFGAGGQDTTISHPTVKPLQLMTKIVINAYGDIVDPFMGSGTTGVACIKMRRSFIGIEISEEYFDIACARIQRAYDQPDMFVASPPKQEQLEADL